MNFHLKTKSADKSRVRSLSLCASARFESAFFVKVRRKVSTRAQIGFYDKVDQPVEKHVALIYKHSDGYPEGIIPYLIEFAKEIKRLDAEYASARFLQFMCNSDDLHMEKFSKRNKMSRKVWENLGFGICNAFHGDIEYYYAVNPEGVQIYACRYDGEPETSALSKLSY